MKKELTILGKEFIPNSDTVNGLKKLSIMHDTLKNNAVNGISAIIEDIIINYPTYKIYLNNEKLFKKEIYSSMIKEYKKKELGNYGNSLLKIADKILNINNLKLDYSKINMNNLKKIASAKNLNKAEINKLFDANLIKKEYNEELLKILAPLQIELQKSELSQLEELIKTKFNDINSLNELESFIQKLKNGN